ncbi:MAG: AAA family ATPase [Gammaproteobacteria bacterium]|nr:AAA family ATPase [Gammaproteobacteria bacterium]
MNHKTPLNVDQLYRHCDITQLKFKTTEELPRLEGMVGQERALDALEFGIGIRQQGYNLFVLGPSGSGKHTITEQHLQIQSSQEPTPPDCCYVNDFKHPQRPWLVQLAPGLGTVLSQDMEQLLEDLRSAIPNAFEAEEYHARLNEIEDQLKQKIEKSFADLGKDAEQHDVTLLKTPHGFAFAPVKNGEVLKPKEYRLLAEKEQNKYEEVISVLEEKLNLILRQQSQWQREARQEVHALNREIALFAAGHLIDDLKAIYKDYEKLQAYFDAVLEDVISHLDDFRRGEDESQGMFGLNGHPSFHRYRVNVFVDNSDTDGSPVIYENNPLYQNLLGRVEHKAQMGTLTTDFTLLKPGALHLANGGYLILDATKLLQQPFAWEGLKRALTSRELSIQSLADQYSLISTVGLEPEPVPLNLKVILVGERLLYYLLHEYDPEFAELFKVAADFESEIEHNEENVDLFAKLIGTIVKNEQLLPFQNTAVGRVIEYSSRLIEDSQKLSTHLRSIADLLREADYWAAKAGQKVVSPEHVQHAIDQQVRRADRIQQGIYEEIRRGTVLIDTQGEKVAQVNALSVMELGEHAFGQPSRVTATARLGEGEVVDIEREVEMGGAIHSKGVFILANFLGARYAQDQPLSLHASLVFEQSYGGIEGDSASMAELCALLSALSDVAIKQSLAITGSVNQLGESQAIGGANEKIEGFYDVCKAMGFNGEQGVLIPNSNIQHLMLREDVRQSTDKGEFHIYAYENVDQAIELLTGLPAGEKDDEGEYPEGSINRLVYDRLAELEDIKEKAKAGKDESDKEDHDDESENESDKEDKQDKESKGDATSDE